eukprot:COSAG01_NODE_9866_length_2317_cov_122.664563_2_plen_103_part_00
MTSMCTQMLTKLAQPNMPGPPGLNLIGNSAEASNTANNHKALCGNVHSMSNAYKYIRNSTEYTILVGTASSAQQAIDRILLFTKMTKNGRRRFADEMFECVV